MFTSENVLSQALATSLHLHHTHVPSDISSWSLALCLCGIPCVGSGRPHPHSMDIALIDELNFPATICSRVERKESNPWKTESSFLPEVRKGV